jgi:hypothetical protein
MNKSYEIEVRERPGYLHIRVTGENTPANALAYLSEVRIACVERGCSSVMIEENLRGPSLNIVQIYNIVKEASARTAPLALRIAYVDVNPEHSRSNMRFAEDVAVNLGVNVRVFATLPEAAKWIAQPANDAAK